VTYYNLTFKLLCQELMTKLLNQNLPGLTQLPKIAQVSPMRTILFPYRGTPLNTRLYYLRMILDMLLLDRTWFQCL